MNKVIVPISGGIDSTVLLHHAVKSGIFDEVHAISFHYGQRHSRELLYAQRTATSLGVSHKVIDLDFFNHINTSSLTNNDIDVAKTRDVLGDAQTVNYVPFRNQMMLSICCAIAESLGANTVYHGAAQVDTQAGYWDGSNEFKGKKKPVGCVQLVRHDCKALLTWASKTLLNIAKRFPGIH